MKNIYIWLPISLGIATSLNIYAEEEEAFELEKVTVTANRTTKTLDELSNKASVITAEEIDRYLHQDIRDLVRYEPGVTVSGLGRFGLSGFNIRGIGGDRVLTLVDGAPIADEFSFGPALSARRNYIDVDALKAVEIVRGPASSLYGSNAIGGLVTFITKDPSDYYQNSDDNQYFSIKSGLDSADASFDNTFTYATGDDRVQGMLVATHRNGGETETYYTADRITGAGRMSANPIDNTEINILGKMVFQPNDDHQFKFTAEKYRASTDTSVLTQAGSVVFGTVKLSVDAEDSRDRSRFGFEYLGTAATRMYDEVHANVYFQNSDSEQDTFEERLSTSQVRQTRTRNSFYEQENVGFKINFVKDIDTTVTQQWVYGIDYDSSDITTLRLGQTVITETGEQLPEFSNFPTRDFPNSEYKSYGIFIQNELTFLDGDLSIIPQLTI